MERTVVINRQSAPQRLALAVEAVGADGAVEVEKLLVLRRQGRSLLCEVIDPTPRSHRCELEYDVLVENARHAFEACGLAALLRDMPCKWSVVTADEDGQPVRGKS
jgi:hypothetical protein